MCRAKLAPNLAAFLDMLAVSEGTSGIGDDGYNVLVGGNLFASYKDHPRILVRLNKAGLKSTAAGRYQFLAKTWDSLRERLQLPDFSPIQQDQAAVELIREQKALPLVVSGDLDGAVARCAPVWASLPGAGYGQRENDLADLKAAYVAAGGAMA